MGKLICLVGLHGSGKTTVGNALKSQGIVASHISCGDLVRLAKRGMYPADVPYKLMSSLTKHNQGTPFQDQTAQMLAEYIIGLARQKDISVDGFPSASDHIRYLAKYEDLQVWHVFADEQTRQNRLIKRGEESRRKWSPGSSSERDIRVDETIQACLQTGVEVREFNNDGTLNSLPAKFQL